jgi:hypothetical protein
MLIEFDSSTGEIVLKINDISLCQYSSVDDAVHDVYSHATGYLDWDKLWGSVVPPKNISEWEKESVKIGHSTQFQNRSFSSTR